MSATERRGFACSGLLSLDEIRETAAEAEGLGYTSIWITVLRDATDPVRVLSAALDATQEIDVALGLVPLDAFPAARLAPALEGSPRRVIVGLGVGRHTRDAARFWRNEAMEFRSRAAGVRIAVGSYGARVLQAGGSCADAVLLNWMTGERVRWAARQVDTGAAAAGRTSGPCPIYVYVPTAPAPEAASRSRAALLAMGREAYHLRHQATIEDTARLGAGIDLSAAPPAELPAFDSDAVSVVNPLGPNSRAERRALLRACRPFAAVRC